MGPQFPGLTLALRENLLPVLAGQTVHPVLLCLTVSHLLPQSYKLLRHLDSLDVAQCVVALSSQYERHGVCGIVIFISTSIRRSILLIVFRNILKLSSFSFRSYKVSKLYVYKVVDATHSCLSEQIANRILKITFLCWTELISDKKLNLKQFIY